MHQQLTIAFMCTFIAAVTVTNAVVLKDIKSQIIVKEVAMPKAVNKNDISSNYQDDPKFLEHKMPLTINAIELRTKEEYKLEAEPIKVDGFEWHFYAEKIAKEFLTLKLLAYPLESFYGTYEIEIQYRISILNGFNGNGNNLKNEEMKLEKIICGTDKLPRSSVFQQLVIDDLLNPKKDFLQSDAIQILIEFTITSTNRHNLKGIVHDKDEHIGTASSRNEEEKATMPKLVPNSVIENVDSLNNGGHSEAYNKHIRLVIGRNELGEKYETKESNPIDELGFSWKLKAARTESDFLSLELKVVPPTGFSGTYHMEVDYRISILKVIGDNLVKEGKDISVRGADRIPKTHLYFPEVAKFEDLLKPANHFLHDGSIDVKADFTITYAIGLVIEHCEGLFRQPNFKRSIWKHLGPLNWQLEAIGETSFLGLYLRAKPPADYKGNYSIAIDYRFSLINDDDKHLIDEKHGQICTEKANAGWGDPKMAKFDDLLNKYKNFLLSNGSIVVLVEFRIKSFAMDSIDPLEMLKNINNPFG